MEDTSLENRKIVRDIVKSKTAEERFLICAQMYEDAKEFAKIGMPDSFSPREQERYIFKRIHGCYPEESVTRVP
jgi:hypothetical protein